MNDEASGPHSLDFLARTIKAEPFVLSRRGCCRAAEPGKKQYTAEQASG